ITLGSGQTAACIVTFLPQSGGTATAALSLVFNTQTSYRHKRRASTTTATMTVPVSGLGVTAGQLLPTPSSLAFGNVQVGSTQTLPETITNSGGSSLTISQASVTGAGFGVTGTSLPLSLNPGQSTSFNLTFTPQAGGTQSGSLSIMSNGSTPTIAIPLTGTGVLSAGTLSSNPASLSFGNVQLGNTQAVSETLINSGNSSLTISQANLSSSTFNISGLTLPLTLNAGQSTTFSVVFAPQLSGNTGGNLTIVSNASNSTLNVSLSGTGVAPALLSASAQSLSFGSVATGTSQTRSETVTNAGGSALTISQVTSTGTGFSFGGINPPVTLSPGQNFTFSVSFTPTSAGNASGALSIVSNASNPNYSVTLTGSGVAPGQLAVTPATMSFGSVTVGSTFAQTGTLSASSAPVTVSSIGGNSSEFSVSGISLPLTIAAGSTASFKVIFSPQASGTASASLAFVSNAFNTPTLQSLTGNGIAAVQHSVALTWNPSTSTNVVGYNVYRGTTSGGPYTKLNSAPDPGTSDTDTTVQSGQTYYYVVSAIDSNANESLFSNQVQAVIP
ncbi:MAG TPA: choice-of-anchor D domain-containing protein, partial [Terriglobales bacterium]|nr:choice-of-anchor D domain-containing protein [Terriglobales bacterium]